jgi:hypothetical protein
VQLQEEEEEERKEQETSKKVTREEIKGEGKKRTRRGDPSVSYRWYCQSWLLLLMREGSKVSKDIP